MTVTDMLINVGSSTNHQDQSIKLKSCAAVNIKVKHLKILYQSLLNLSYKKRHPYGYLRLIHLYLI